jgi:hypothetical protein
MTRIKIFILKLKPIINIYIQILIILIHPYILNNIYIKALHIDTTILYIYFIHKLIMYTKKLYKQMSAQSYKYKPNVLIEESSKINWNQFKKTSFLKGKTCITTKSKLIKYNRLLDNKNKTQPLIK